MLAEKIFEQFPRLEIVSVDTLLVYEAYDPIRVAFLTKKIAQDNSFIQPIIVGQEPNGGKRIILDGVNRLEVLKRLGIRDLVAHVVQYFEPTEVELFSNHHYFFEDHEMWLKKIQAVLPGPLAEITLTEAKAGVKNQSLLGYIRSGNTVWSMGNHVDLPTTAATVNKVVDAYLGQTQVCRRSEVDLTGSNVPLELVFRRFTPQEIVSLASSGGTLNSGITRHLVSAYCLGLHVPLSLLESHQTLEEKNKELKNILMKHIMDKGYRFYPRPIYKFDEKE